MVGRGLSTRVVEGVVEISCALNLALMGEWTVTSNTDSLVSSVKPLTKNASDNVIRLVVAAFL